MAAIRWVDEVENTCDKFLNRKSILVVSYREVTFEFSESVFGDATKWLFLRLLAATYFKTSLYQSSYCRSEKKCKNARNYCYGKQDIFEWDLGHLTNQIGVDWEGK